MAGQRIKGFTLIELMVTIAIVGIVVAIAVPSFQSVMADSRVTSDANKIVSAVANARSEAMKRHKSIFIMPKSDDSGYEVKDDLTTLQEYLFSGNVSRKTTANAGLCIRANGLRGDVSGAVCNAGTGSVEIKLWDKVVTGKGRLVTVSLSGSTSVSDYTGAGL